RLVTARIAVGDFQRRGRLAAERSDAPASVGLRRVSAAAEASGRKNEAVGARTRDLRIKSPTVRSFADISATLLLRCKSLHSLALLFCPPKMHLGGIAAAWTNIVPKLSPR